MNKNKRNRSLVVRVFLLVTSLIIVSAGIIFAQATFSVSPTVETQAIDGDFDDPAIWIHPTNPALSLVIGTIKGTGLATFDVNGNLVQLVDQDAGMNNVDLRYNFPLGGDSVDLVVATNRFDPINTLAMYKMNPSTRQLENVTADPPISTTLSEVYGTCMYVSPVNRTYFAFITSKEGIVEQWEMVDNGSGKVMGILHRTFDVGSAVEGCVADDVFALFYAGEEDVAIWKYGAEPDDNTPRTAVDTTAAGHLTADIEGLAIYYTSSDTGYLIASSQGSSEYVIYNRLAPNNYIASFDIVPGSGIDGTSGTDGIDVTNASLGSNFPQGLFVAHDGNDDVAKSNLKLVPWQAIAAGPTPPLTIDTTWDPRSIGLAMSADFTADVLIGPAPLTVNFTNLSSGDFDTCLWGFGDGGSTSSCGNPAYTYTAAGIYDVSLTIAGPDGDDTLKRPSYIWVGDFKNVYLPVALAP